MIGRLYARDRQRQRIRERMGVVALQAQMTTLQSRKSGGGKAGPRSELRLGQPGSNPQVEKKEIVIVERHELGNVHLEGSGSASERVDLRGHLAHFPAPNRPDTQICQASELASSEPRGCTGGREPFGVEPPQNLATHTQSAVRGPLFMFSHFAGRTLRNGCHDVLY
jgi:hypothetical protein